MADVTHDQANLLLRLYELRREPRMREAREWYFANFHPLKDSDTTAVEVRLRSFPDVHADLRSDINWKCRPGVSRRNSSDGPSRNGWHQQPFLAIGILSVHLGAVPDLNFVGVRSRNVVTPGSPCVCLHSDEVAHPFGEGLRAVAKEVHVV